MKLELVVIFVYSFILLGGVACMMYLTYRSLFKKEPKEKKRPKYLRVVK